MGYYRKKPITVEAMLFDGTQRGFDQVCWFISSGSLSMHGDTSTMVIHALDGDRTVRAGDYIIKDIDGAFYPCEPEIFLETYDEVF